MASNHSDDLEKGASAHISKSITPGGHPVDNSHTPIPNQHRVIGNPAPLGLTSFGCGFFIVSAFTLGARGVHIPNVAVPVLILYGGIMQSITGIISLLTGDTFGGAVFCSYGSFNLSYGALYLPAFGVAQAYTLADGTLSPEFGQAIGIYLMAWMCVTILFLLGALKTNVSVVSTLVFTALAFLCLGVAQFIGSANWATAGGSFGMLATATSWWAAMAGFWSPTTTYKWIRVSPVAMA